MRYGMLASVVGALALLLAPAAPAADTAAVDRAVERAVNYLKGTQQPNGTWSYVHTERPPQPGPRSTADTTSGATALAGLALLEAGVAPEDPVIQKAAAAVRAASADCTCTYSLSLMIMFLDRLGDPAEVPLIEGLAVRLLAGQDPGTGGWSYDCPPPSAAEVRRLQAVPRGDPTRRPPGGEPMPHRSVNDLAPQIRGQIQQIEQRGAGRGGVLEGGDNSNTQFAVLALWIARRHGIPIDSAMKRIDSRFHHTQNRDGGWGYVASNPGGMNTPTAAGSTPSMTCAGLLGLALGHGNAMEATLRAGGTPGTTPAPGVRRSVPDFGNDAVVQRGFRALGGFLSRGNPAPARPQPGLPGGLRPEPRARNTEYYFLFSLERVAVAYGLPTIGGKDWYEHGAALLLRTQERDGSWAGEFAEGGCDTSFGILFLRRANLARDLTATLKGKIQDVTLKGSTDIPGLKDRGPDEATTPPPEEGPRPGSAAPPGEARPRPAEPRPAPTTPRPTPPPAAVPVPERPPAATTPPADTDAARIGDELVKADAARQEAVLAKLRDSKGAEYTDALAYAIHKLKGSAQGKARDALADRLTRMSGKTLTTKLQDDDYEVRRAAALAAAMKGDKAHVRRLIELLEDQQEVVAHAAHAALKALTGQDFGPGPEPSRADIVQAVGAWKSWWSRNGDR
jgi:hypothetical protein